MAELIQDQLELLQCAREGLPPWGGTTVIDLLRHDIELLLAQRLVEPDGQAPNRLAAHGAAGLDAIIHRRSN